MNVRIARMYRVLVAAFLALIGMLAYWQIIAAPSLASRKTNQRLVYRELSIERGRIVSADGVVLATNVARKQNGRTYYYRRYPQDSLAAHVVGYSSIQAARAGIEQSKNDYLTGATTDLAGSLDRIGERLRGERLRGNDIELSLSARAQRVALDALRATGQPGAVVALEPTTGRVLVMASWPTFNPNLADRGFAKLLRAKGQPLYNRATQGLYPPGSTFKVVTAASALEQGVFTPDSTFPGGTCVKVYDRDLCNASGEIAPDDNTLTDALVHSYNTTFARVGQELGQERLVETMRRLGIWTRIPFDYPTDQQSVSAIYRRPGRIASPQRPIDVARVAIGQGGLLVTPLEMAMITAAVGNGGRLIAPRLVDRVATPQGRTLVEGETRELGDAFAPDVATALRAMMTRVVDEGTGQAAQIGGLQVAGKTGTAQTGRGDLNDAWFIALAPVEAPGVAIAVVVEDTTQFGGQVAAPIARDVIQALGEGG